MIKNLVGYAAVFGIPLVIVTCDNYNNNKQHKDICSQMQKIGSEEIPLGGLEIKFKTWSGGEKTATTYDGRSYSYKDPEGLLTSAISAGPSRSEIVSKSCKQE